VFDERHFQITPASDNAGMSEKCRFWTSLSAHVPLGSLRKNQWFTASKPETGVLSIREAPASFG
jgi:hypothetical protein